TLDLGMQRAASNAIRAGVPRGAQGALVSIDRDGAVRAMVGGTDYATSNYNRAVTALRQPGSAWKVFVYLAALEAGFRPEDKVVDEAVTINGWSPRNSSGTYSGEITLRTAFAYSKNTVAAKIGEEVGTSSIANMARRFGITTPIATTPAMVLGSSETRVIDMTRAFASVAARGRSVTPYAISKVTTIDGNVIYKHKPARQVQLVEDYVAGAMTDLMQTAVATGTGRAASIGRPVAGKTGTTSSNKDGWFLGFSSGLTTGVWMGRDDARAVGNLQGGTAPAAAWANYMRTAVAKRPVENFDTDVTFPERLDDEEMMLGEDGEEILVDENGMPIEGEPAGEAGGIPPELQGPEPLDEAWIDQALGRSGEEEQGGEQPPPAPRNSGPKTVTAPGQR
ncbi:MAG: penicillin-binding transpeptidase domain-containing protein, partial [Sphingorhabdus sp.]|uniref:transglycosylase domain-containing protein n=1 Tax=Sphingorhabdus sp. TaxID=1902408 RepID=UPI003CB4FDD0